MGVDFFCFPCVIRMFVSSLLYCILGSFLFILGVVLVGWARMDWTGPDQMARERRGLGRLALFSGLKFLLLCT